jgi:hypothetical protein
MISMAVASNLAREATTRETRVTTNIQTRGMVNMASHRVMDKVKILVASLTRVMDHKASKIQDHIIRVARVMDHKVHTEDKITAHRDLNMADKDMAARVLMDRSKDMANRDKVRDMADARVLNMEVRDIARDLMANQARVMETREVTVHNQVQDKIMAVRIMGHKVRILVTRIGTRAQAVNQVTRVGTSQVARITRDMASQDNHITNSVARIIMVPSNTVVRIMVHRDLTKVMVRDTIQTREDNIRIMRTHNLAVQNTVIAVEEVIGTREVIPDTTIQEGHRATGIQALSMVINMEEI